jgi:hypothetical protein
MGGDPGTVGSPGHRGNPVRESTFDGSVVSQGAGRMGAMDVEGVADGESVGGACGLGVVGAVSAPGVVFGVAGSVGTPVVPPPPTWANTGAAASTAAPSAASNHCGTVIVGLLKSVGAQPALILRPGMVHCQFQPAFPRLYLRSKVTPHEETTCSQCRSG